MTITNPSGFLHNAGTITSGTSAAFHIVGSLGGGISNSGTISSIGNDALIVDNAVATGVINSGFISGGTGHVGASFAGTITGNVENTSTGLITAGSTDIAIGGDLIGSLLNEGILTSTSGTAVSIMGNVTGDLVNASGAHVTAADYGIHVDGNVGGNINDGGSISAGKVGIYVGGNVTGSVTVAAGTTISNSGGYGIDIVGSIGAAAPVNGTGIFVAGTIGGGITNSGMIQVGLVGVLAGSSLTSLTNVASGSIISTGTVAGGETAIRVNPLVTVGTLSNSGFIGAYRRGIDNEGTITTLINDVGGIITNNSDRGQAIANNGSIQSLVNNGTLIVTSTGGDTDPAPNTGVPNPMGIANYGTIASINNSGTISVLAAPSATGIYNGSVNGGGGTSIGALTNTGSIVVSGASSAGIDNIGNLDTLTNGSTGTIQATGPGSFGVFNKGTIGAVSNAGLISGEAMGLRDTGTIGAIVNGGTISGGSFGVLVTNGGKLGNLTNTGTISGTAAIDTSAEGAATTITQADGVIQGAVNLSPSFADLMRITGGTVAGSITGSAATVDFATGQTYTLTNGINVGAINVQSGTLVLNHDVGVANTFTNSATLEVDAARNITGSFAQTATGALNIGINNDTGSVGKLVVSQNASIDPSSTVTLKELGSTINTGLQTYTIVAAGGTGSYTGVNAPPATITIANPFIPLSVSTSIVGNDLVVTLAPPTSSNTGVPSNNNGVPFDNNGPTSPGQQQVNAALNATANSRSVAVALTQLYQSGSAGASTVLNGINSFFNNTALPLTEAQKIQVVSAQLVPSNAAVDTGTSQAFSNASTTAVVQRLQLARAFGQSEETGISAGSPPQNSAIWGQLLGYTARRSTDGDSQGDKSNSAGAAFGADTLVAPNIRLGGSFSYGESFVNGLDLAAASSTRIDSYQVSTYGTYDGGPWYVNGQIGVGFDNYNQNRGLDFLAGSAHANYNGVNVLTHIDAGRDFYWGATKLTPIASLTYSHQAINSYTESITNEDIGRVNLNSVQTEVGAQTSWLLPLAGGYIMPTVKIGWLHDWIHSAIQTTATLGGVSFNTFASRPGADGADIGLAVTFYKQGNWQLQGQYNANLYRDYTSNAVLANLKFYF